MDKSFELIAPFEASGDQPEAIAKIARGIESGAKKSGAFRRHRIR